MTDPKNTKNTENRMACGGKLDYLNEAMDLVCMYCGAYRLICR